MTLKARELEVYKRAFKAAMGIHNSAKEWPKFEVYGGLSGQIRRASQGICLNIAEGLAKSGALEQRRYLNMAVGSVGEVQSCLEFAEGFGYIEKSQFSDWDSEYSQIGRMLGAMMVRRERP